MSPWGDDGQGPSIRQAVLAVTVMAGTMAADVGGFGGHVTALRFLLFGAAGLLAAASAVLASVAFKKSLR